MWRQRPQMFTMSTTIANNPTKECRDCKASQREARSVVKERRPWAKNWLKWEHKTKRGKMRFRPCKTRRHRSAKLISKRNMSSKISWIWMRPRRGSSGSWRIWHMWWAATTAKATFWVTCTLRRIINLISWAKKLKSIKVKLRTCFCRTISR